MHGSALDPAEFVPNGLIQLINFGGMAASFDAKGNLTSDGSRTFGYTPKYR